MTVDDILRERNPRSIGELFAILEEISGVHFDSVVDVRIDSKGKEHRRIINRTESWELKP